MPAISRLVLIVLSLMTIGRVEALELTGISSPYFDRTNRLIVLTLCTRPMGCGTGIYSIDNNTLHFLPKPKTENWYGAKPSPISNKIVFARRINGARFGHIAVMDSNGERIRNLTKRLIFPSHPSFSADENQIVYSHATDVDTSRGWRPRAFQIRVIDKEDGALVWESGKSWILVIKPIFYKDKSILFSGYYNYYDLGAIEYQKKFGDHYIHRHHFDNKKNEIRPFIQYGKYSTKPSADLRGKKLVFVSRIKEKNVRYYNYELYLKKNNRVLKLTNLKSSIVDVSISYDGSKISFLSDKMRDQKYELYVINSDGKNLRKIDLEKAELVK